MTFEDFSEALRAEGFYRDDIGQPAGPESPAPVVFTRPLTGRVYCPRTAAALDCRLSPNGKRTDSCVWCGYETVLAAARLREV